MQEIRFHGRGGQGTVVCANILAETLFIERKYVQSFPFFGVERRGAPVTAFARVDYKPIRIAQHIYEPDYIVVLDKALLKMVPDTIVKGSKNKTVYLFNMENSSINLNIKDEQKLYCVNATEIAIKYGLGTKFTPVVNTAILGAFIRISQLGNFESLLKAIERHVPVKVEENKKAAEEAYNAVNEIRDMKYEIRDTKHETLNVEHQTLNLELAHGPVARESSKNVQFTGAWRTFKPVVDYGKCIDCYICWKYCPEPCIEINSEGKIVVDYRYCKGCGICATECPKKAIDMVLDED